MTAETMNMIVALSSVVAAASTVAIACFSYTNLKVSKQIAWFTGAMESHSQLQVMLAAKREPGAGVEVVWWDPTLEAAPSSMKHGAPVQLSRIYIYLPPELRTGSEKIKR